MTKVQQTTVEAFEALGAWYPRALVGAIAFE